MDIDILERIKELAKKRDLSISQLESKLGFGQNYLYSWKKRTPGVDKVKEVADFFNVSVDYLLGRDDKPDNDSEQNHPFDTLAAHAADRNHKFTPEEINRIKGYIDGIIDNYESKHSDDK